jgi:hypothetical protein
MSSPEAASSHPAERTGPRWLRGVLLGLVFVVALAVDVGTGISTALCENCGPPSEGQKLTLLIAAGVCTLLALAVACWLRLTAATVLLMIAVLLVVHWGTIALSW